MAKKLALIAAAVALLLVITGGIVFALLKSKGRTMLVPPSAPPAGAAADTSQLPVIYAADFTANPGEAWTANTLSTTPSGRPFLGPFDTETASLRLHHLPPHKLLRVSMELFIIDTWDGSGRFGWKPPATDGPDYLEIDLDGRRTLLRATFSTLPQESPNFLETSKVQTYPSPIPSRPNRGGTGASAVNGLGFVFTFRNVNKSFPMDGTYPVVFTVPHTADTMRIDLRGAGLTGVSDESWGVANVKVEAIDAEGVAPAEETKIAEDWNTVLGEDPVKARDAFWRLIAAGDATVAFLEKQGIGFGIDPDAVTNAVVAIRTNRSDPTAMAALVAMGPPVEPLLKSKVAADPSLKEPVLKVLREIEVAPIESPRLRRAAAASRVLGLIDTPAAQTLQAKCAAAPQSVTQPGTAEYDAEWRERFDAVYSLAPGQMLKYIPPDSVPERERFIVEHRRRQAQQSGGKVDLTNDPNRGVGFEVLCVDGKIPRDGFLRFLGPNFRVANQPVTGMEKYLSAIGAQGHPARQAALKYFVVPKSLLDINLPGDWLVSDHARQEQLMAELFKIVKQQTGREIGIGRATQQQEVVVVSGKYAYKPDKPDDPAGIVHVYAAVRNQKVDPKPQDMTIATMLDSLSGRTAWRFIDDTGTPETPITVKWHGTSQLRFYPETPAWEKMLLDNLAKQTSLEYKREKRSFEYDALVDKTPTTLPAVEK